VQTKSENIFKKNKNLLLLLNYNFKTKKKKKKYKDSLVVRGSNSFKEYLSRML